MKESLVFGLVFALGLLGFAAASEKRWVADTEWNTASNWLDSRLPDFGSHVVFPLDTRHAVGIASSAELSLSRLDLFREGSLVLPSSGRIQLTAAREKGAAKMSRWIKEGHLFWADPGNWGGAVSKAAPHLEQVPCRQDDVVLPSVNRTTSILLPIQNIRVRSIRTAGAKHPFTEWQWMKLESLREFTGGRFTVSYSDYSCDKCSCQEDAQLGYLEEICAICRSKCDRSSACEYPLTVEGHCCPYCGGRILLSSEASVSMSGMAADEALEAYATKLSWHVRRTWTGRVEVLLKGRTYYSETDIAEALIDIHRMLEKNGIEVLSLETAGAALSDHSRLTITLGPLFSTLLLVLGFLLLLLLYFGYSLGYILSGCTEAFSSVRDGIRATKPQTVKPFSFARFENVSEGNVEIVEGTGTSGSNVAGGENETDNDAGDEDAKEGREETAERRFENPLYRSKRRDREGTKMLDIETALSLSTLKSKVEEERAQETEMNVD
ncbi:hypothetical protein KM043_013949 [Ampulex compressa]|nr:hypothetical protein KM043_013949 [Ampulex compressa]